MPEQIRCPSCNAALRVPDNLLGKNVKCPKCQKTFTACILAMIPCVNCCILGLPFGIWGLVVLNKPEVKDAFR
jgi:predicted Zn finger-like uncharacterized protein